MTDIETSEIANLIFNKIHSSKEELKRLYDGSKDEIGFFFIDDLLPEDLALKLNDIFPKEEDMRCLKSLREYKFISAQMNKHNSLLEKVLYAFQDERIISEISKITDIKNLYADPCLYAGGLSMMRKDNFLKPHLDNSHDANRARWRVLNLLYYVSPDWKLENGGNLEIWPNGTGGKQITIESKFNRLAVMATHDHSWHSVSKVVVNKSRKCISNYYFSDYPLKDNDKFHVTTFRGRPNEFITNLILKSDSKLRMLIRKIFKNGIRKNPHIYKKDN
ncbi:2OG-Fe(II) oxygenase [Mesoflavibacter zeaxanthinifaciens]|uniref:2OG-Fe(II) oxygenase n=1 Tax=Mesoflavibacter zeaxanthinifaciens TaxID=393060 RepID=UPI000405CB9F|nr:2OG-Fe(II) oxygenase [Mesoflavibacter zeaxanthinifaciens]